MVDDDRSDHLLMLMAVEEARIDAEITFFDHGAELLLHLADVQDLTALPDIIVLDLRMPVLDGHATLERLQAHPVFWQIPVVVFSSSTLRSDSMISFARGAQFFETKPSGFDGMIEFAHRLHDWARTAHYELHELHADPVAALQLRRLANDTRAEIEDDILFRLPDA